MDIGGLKKETLTAWVPFDDDTEVLIGYLSREDLREIGKGATMTRFVKHQKSEQFDQDEADRLLGRKAVKDWRALPGRPGFTDGGAPFPYSPENCDLLMEKFNEFSNFVNVTCIDFSRFIEEEKAADEKN
jgi:hypothetical protein